MAEGSRPTLEAEPRTPEGSRATRRLRRQGLVPGVVYGGGDCVPFQVNSRTLIHALHAGSAVLDLKLDGDARPVIVKDQQNHPVRGEILHIDLLQVRLDEKIQTTVAVELLGVEEAPGAKEGGVLEHVSRELNIEALPTDIPERIAVDVSSMQAAETMSLSQVEAPAGVTFLDDPEETVIATITVPTQVELPEEVEEETELVGEEAVDTEVPAEGEGQPSGGEPTEGEAAEGRGSSTP
jgi:large subunit ribosomal protein L25